MLVSTYPCNITGNTCKRIAFKQDGFNLKKTELLNKMQQILTPEQKKHVANRKKRRKTKVK